MYIHAWLFNTKYWYWDTINELVNETINNVLPFRSLLNMYFFSVQPFVLTWLLFLSIYSNDKVTTKLWLGILPVDYEAQNEARLGLNKKCNMVFICKNICHKYCIPDKSKWSCLYLDSSRKLQACHLWEAGRYILFALRENHYKLNMERTISILI